MRSSSFRLWIFLSILGLVLWFTLSDGAFTRDEDHQLVSVVALQHGGVFLPVPKSIPRSVELAAFNAGIWPLKTDRYKRDEALLAPRVPPLYAVMALPFAQLGWRYLFLLNLLAYLLAAWLVFLYTRRYATRPHSPWLACLIFLFGSYTLEYATAVWPHMLSLCLCLAAAYASARTRDDETLWWAALAGLFVGLATGVRYQNAVWCAAIGLGIFFGAPRRFKASLAYLGGVLGPLLANSWFNYLRFQSWNPITKGKGYLSSYSRNSITDFFLYTWVKIFDFSAHPPNIRPENHIILHQDSGVYVVFLAVRKAFVQSIPWVLIALIVLLWVWGRRNTRYSDAQRRELRAQSLIVFMLLGAFAVMGMKRHAGFCHNQRYFFDLIPLVAIALVWSMEVFEFRWKALLAGVLGSAGIVLSLFALGTHHPLRLWLVVKLPLLLGACALAVWWLGQSRPTWGRWAWGLVGLCLGWACAIHITEDVRSMRYLRSIDQQRRMQMERLIPKTPSVLFAYGGANSSFASLRLSHGLILVDPWLDYGRDAPRLAKAFLQKKYRVFLLVSGMHPDIVKKMLQTFKFSVIHGHRWINVLELKPKHAPVPPRKSKGSQG